MRLSGNEEYEYLCNIASQASSYKSSIDSMSSSFMTSIGDAQTIVGTVSMAGWQDSIEAKFESYLRELTSAINTISDDFTSGGLASIKAIMGQVVSGLEGAKGTALELKYAKEELGRIPSTITVKKRNPDQRSSYQTGTGKAPDPYIYETSPNPAYTELQTRISELKTSLQGQAEGINGLLTQLESITFGSTLTATAAASAEANSLSRPTEFVAGGLNALSEADMYQNGNLNRSNSYYVQVGLIDGTTVDAIIRFNGNSRSASDSSTWQLTAADGSPIYKWDVDMDSNTGDYCIQVYQTTPENYGNATIEGYQEVFGGE